MNLRHGALTLAALVLSTALAAQGRAAVLVSYLDNDIATSTTSVAPNQLDSGLVSATNLDITGYGSNSSDVGTSSGLDDLYVKSTLVDNSAINLAEYLTFTVTAQTDIDLTSLTFDLGARYSTGQPSGTSYTANYVVRSSTDSFTSFSERDTGSATVNENGSNVVYSLPTHADISLNDALAAGNSIEFRIYFFDNNSHNDVGTRFDSLVLNGAAVPEPASLALLGAGGLLMLPRRRG